MTITPLHTERGQSLLEILFALSIAVVTMGSLAYMVLGTLTHMDETGEDANARLYAEEGLHAVRHIAHTDFGALQEGTYGLAEQGNTWVLTGSSDTQDIFTRSVTLEQIDSMVFDVVSQVTWEATPVRTKEVTYNSYVADSNQTRGDAASIIIDTEGAYMSGTTTMDGMTIENTSPEQNIEVTHIRMEWDGGALIDTFSINTNEVYTASTSGQIASGELMDVTDVSIPAATTYVFGPVEFTEDITSADILITVYFADSSKRHVRIDNL